MTRVLPGVYVSLNDLSQVPEGAQTLNVGYVLKANRGKVNEWSLCTNPTDFLTKYTFSGKPSQTDDPTFHSIIKTMAQTNAMYVVRAAKNPLYGGALVKKSKVYGKVIAVDQEAETITLESTTVGGTEHYEIPKAGEYIAINGTSLFDGYYIVKEVAGNVVTVTGNIRFDEVSEGSDYADILANSVVYRAPIVPLSAQKIGDVEKATPTMPVGDKTLTNVFVLSDNVVNKMVKGDRITVKEANQGDSVGNNGTFTVKSVEFVPEETVTRVEVEETVEEGTSGVVYFNSIKNPEAFKEIFTEDDLMLITGIDEGAYNGKESFTIVSSLDNKDSMVYYKGAPGLFDGLCTFDTMDLDVRNVETGELLETFTFSRDPQAQAIDGSLLFVEDVVKGSAYIKVINNDKNTEVPNSTLNGLPVSASGGSDGEAVTADDLVTALSVFGDKTIPISILGNGCSAQAESEKFQQALVALAVERKDCMVFLNDRKEDEKATLPSDKAQNIVRYKKETLGSTSFYGCMYAPHVKITDIFNSKDVSIGSDAIAIAGWLNVINNLNYPYAYAGPRNGLVSGATCEWKIGDMSGEAQLLNDASINYVAFDGRAGRYYMQCQNTLQIANSAMRNIGTILNVLDIKQAMVTNIKEYLGLPITDTLRGEILDIINEYLSPMVGVRFYNYAFQDVTTANDLDNDTLRYLLTLSPTRYANRIYLVMNIVRSSFDFSILQSA